MADCHSKCKMPKLKELVPCVARCAACGLYWELKATWVPYTKATPKRSNSSR